MSRTILLTIIGTILLSVATTLAILYVAVTHFSLDELIRYSAPEEVSETLSDALEEESIVSIPEVVERTIPAVVSVVVTAEVPIVERYYEEYAPFGDFFGGGFAIPRQRQIGTEEREVGGGTGFFVSSEGHIVTNRHVVDQDDVSYSIVTHEGDSYEVTVVARDPMLDIAVLEVVQDSEERSFPYLRFDEDELRLGQTVIAIGNVLAEFPNSVSVGVVSGLARTIVASAGFGRSELLEGVIQTDAAINRGNSGGPLLNTDGEVIGVNVAAAGGSENIGFALPASIVSQVYQSVALYGEIRRPFLGVRYRQLTEQMIEENELGVEYGVLVIAGEQADQPAVLPRSPAEAAGVREGDVILAIDGRALDGEQSFGTRLRDYAVGDTATLTIWRDGEERSVTVTFAAAEDMD